MNPRHPILELTRTRVLEFIREPEAIFWVFIFPVLLAGALGLAFRNQPAEKLRVATLSGPAAEALSTSLAASPDLSVTVLSPAAAKAGLRAGKLDLVIDPTPADGATANASAPGAAPAPWPEYAFTYDPTRPQSRMARFLVADALERGLGRKDLAAIRERIMEEPGGRYIDFLIPGLIGMNLMGSGMWGIGFNLVQARSRKLLKRLAATPMRKSHYLLAFMLSRLIFLIPEVAVLMVFGWLIFGTKIYGSFFAFALVSLLGAFAFNGLGLLVAARSQSIEAVSGWMNVVMMPMYVLSGAFFSYSRFPEWSWPLIRALPLTALNDSLRSIMNEGAPLSASFAPILVLLTWTLASFALALKIFKWQ